MKKYTVVLSVYLDETKVSIEDLKGLIEDLVAITDFPVSELKIETEEVTEDE